MFNIINLKRNCPNRGADVEWQTKDLVLDGIYPVANVLKTYTVNKRISGEVYTLCDECGVFSEAEIKNGKLYGLKVRKRVNGPQRVHL